MVDCDVDWSESKSNWNSAFNRSHFCEAGSIWELRKVKVFNFGRKRAFFKKKTIKEKRYIVILNCRGNNYEVFRPMKNYPFCYLIGNKIN